MQLSNKIEQFLNIRARYLCKRSATTRKRLDRLYSEILEIIPLYYTKERGIIKNMYDEIRGV